MTTRELLHWSRLHDRRARARWRSPWLIAIAAGSLLGAFVAWRARSASVAAASTTWLAAALVAFGLAFLRVPFHLYWRADAPLLAQLPIAGGTLADVAFVRCARAAAATTLAVIIAALPLGTAGDEHVLARHALFAATLAVAAAGLLPAVALWAATLVAVPADARRATGTRVMQAVRIASGSANPERVATAARTGSPASSGTILGALPGFAATAVLVVALLARPFLIGAAGLDDVAPALGGIAIASVLAWLAARASAARVMGTILRDVSALDRQRLAPLEIKPPTAIERAIASLLGEAGLPYRKDARLMRRRYPMAFALGALAFVVLAVIGLARPEDPMAWLVATLGGCAVYAFALAGRLRRPPIELARLSATLPIGPAARRRAKRAWLAGWLVVFVLAPAAFALARR
jgi:hypothetical protein